MICLNEAAHIRSAIALFHPITDEIVVIDGGSSDDSMALARSAGARVLQRPFADDFSAQRNFAVGQMRSQWIYMHDPDETLEPELLALLPRLVSDQAALRDAEILPRSPEEFDCFGIARKNFIDGRWTESYPDYQYRLFRNYCRYRLPVHEVVANYRNRTEVDFRNCSRQLPARFNILHHKSAARQAQQAAHYERIRLGLRATP